VKNPLLLASAGSLDDIADCVQQFYCGDWKKLVAIDDRRWLIAWPDTGKILDGVRVIKKGKRYRFEMEGSQQ